MRVFRWDLESRIQGSRRDNREDAEVMGVRLLKDTESLHSRRSKRREGRLSMKTRKTLSD